MRTFSGFKTRYVVVWSLACGLTLSSAAYAQVVGYVDNPQTNSSDWATAVAGFGSGVNNNLDFEAHPTGALQSDFYAASDGVTLTATGAVGDVVFGTGPNDGNTAGSNPGEGSHTASNYISVSSAAATLTITFDAPTYGAGLYTIDKFAPNAVPMTIEAFTGPDGTGTSLGAFNSPDINFQPDNLYFMGVTSAAGDIQSVVFSYDGSSTGDRIGLDNIVFAGEGGVVAPSELVRFGTTIDFTDDFDGSVEVTLTCNAGIPLQQSFEISESTSVTFVVDSLVPAEGTRCEIAYAGLDQAYSAEALANGAVTADTCVFVGGTPDAGESGFSISGENSCDIVAEPLPTTVTVNTDYEGVDDPNIDNSFETTIVCENVSPTTGGGYDTVTVVTTDEVFTADWYADPDTGADCMVTLVPASSAAEGDMCEFSFMLGDEEAGCTVVATVFFEGIPTLSQYGMAIMVLLMLGVGFVGMRRFV